MGRNKYAVHLKEKLGISYVHALRLLREDKAEVFSDGTYWLDRDERRKIVAMRKLREEQNG